MKYYTRSYQHQHFSLFQSIVRLLQTLEHRPTPPSNHSSQEVGSGIAKARGNESRQPTGTQSRQKTCGDMCERDPKGSKEIQRGRWVRWENNRTSETCWEVPSQNVSLQTWNICNSFMGCSVVKMVAKLFPIFLGVMLETAEHLESQTVQAAVRDQHTHIDRHVKIPHHWLAAGF